MAARGAPDGARGGGAGLERHVAIPAPPHGSRPAAGPASLPALTRWAASRDGTSAAPPPCHVAPTPELTKYLTLVDAEATANGKVKDAEDALTTKVFAKYGALTEAEVKALVVEDTWIAALAATVQGELARVSQTVTGRVGDLAVRYAVPLSVFTSSVAELAGRVGEHLRRMGLSW